MLKIAMKQGIINSAIINYTEDHVNEYIDNKKRYHGHVSMKQINTVGIILI